MHRTTTLRLFLIAMSVSIGPPAALGQEYGSTVLYPMTHGQNGSFAPSASPTTGAYHGTPVFGGQTVGSYYATLLTASGSVTLSPPHYGSGTAFATDGTQQVGYAGYVYGTGSVSHALLWNGTAASAVDLNPVSFNISFAMGTNGTQQVGYAEVGDAAGTNAFLWQGSAASAVNLNPASLGISGSMAYGTDGVHQVGSGVSTRFGVNHALLWTGTAASAVDLTPYTAEITTTVAYAVSGNQEVGMGSGTGTKQLNHALLWIGTSPDAIDLNPGSKDESVAFDTNGVNQVGWISGTHGANASLWSGSAASVVDLQSLLPQSTDWTDSSAYSIDAAGNIYGLADGTYDGQTSLFAVEWSPVPEPSTTSLLALIGMIWVVRRRRRAV